MPSSLLTLHLIKIFLLTMIAHRSYLGRVHICNIVITGILLFLLISIRITHTPLVSRTNQPNISARSYTSSINNKLKRKQNNSEEGGDNSQVPNPKRKGNPTYHPESPSCSPCALWSQSGSDTRLPSH